MIAALYARKSTDDSDRNAEARSTQRQIDSATTYARTKGWTVDPRYIFVDENTSGAEWKQRPGFNALLAALEPRPPFGVVIVSELSRIGRDTVRTPAAVMRIEEAGVEIRSYLSDAPISLADEAGELHTIFNSLAASFERRRARQRTYDALRRRAEAGAVTGGRCYGYRNVRGGAGYVQRVIDEGEAAVVRRIFALYAEGDGLGRIAKGLNADGVPAPRAGTGSWAPSAVREILRRPLYAGRVVWNRTQKITRRGTKAQRRRPEAEWLTREAPELRIVSAALWEAVERRRIRAAASCPGLTRAGRRAGRPPGVDSRSATLLSGLAQCASCGASLVGFTRSHGTGATRRRVRFYGCVYHKLRGRAVCANSVVIRQARLDAAFLDALAAALDERVIARAVALALEREQARGREAPDRRAALRRERDAITVAVRNLLEAVKSGRATETLLAELAVQEGRAKAIGQELAALEARPRVVPLDRKHLEARLTAMGRDVRGVLGAGRPEARRVLQRVLNGRRVACEPFREPGRRGYRFRATGSYAGVVSQEMRGPNGIRTRVYGPPRASCFASKS
jgi:site-specific DNA recombinase